MKRDITILGRSQGETTKGRAQDIIAERGIDELSDIIVQYTIII